MTTKWTIAAGVAVAAVDAVSLLAAVVTAGKHGKTTQRDMERRRKTRHDAERGTADNAERRSEMQKRGMSGRLHYQIPRIQITSAQVPEPRLHYPETQNFGYASYLSQGT